MRAKLCVATKVILHDEFVDMSSDAKALYMYMCAYANSDGRIDNAKQIMRLLGVKGESLEDLVKNGFVLMPENGVYYIKDWWVNNRYDPYHRANVGESEELKLGLVIFNGRMFKSEYKLNDIVFDEDRL